MPATQQELFKRDWGREFLDTILKRLPHKDLLSVSDAAAVMNKSNATIISLCEQGELVAANTSTGERRYYDILTSSIPEFYKRRLGINTRK